MSAGNRLSFLGVTAVSGVGYSDLSRESGRSTLALATEACRRALADCGIAPAEVDGIVTFSMFNDSVAAQAVATALAVPELTYAVDLALGGQAASMAVALAAQAVTTGMARAVLVYRAMNGRSGVRIGSTSFASSSSQYRYPIGFSAYPQYIAMWARRYLIETGGDESDLAAVVLSQREHARSNARAAVRRPLTLDEYLAQPMFVDPFRVADCTREVDGACAVVVTRLERARQLAVAPAVLDSAAWSTGPGSGFDVADLHSWPDFSRNAHHQLASRLWEQSSIGPADADLAELYDCFSAVPLMTLEALGFAPRGEAGAFVASGETALDGRLPTNTNGGLLCEGYLHGMNTVCEAVLQLQNRCGERQVPGAETAVVTSGALMDGSALVLSVDR